jgi:iduronate 2-sulfatase
MRARALLLGLVLFAGVRCAEAPPERPHVVFISVDDLLPRLGCYGVGDAHTPNIDELAREGALFQRAYAQFAQCGPSRASVLTGLLPERCGVLRNDADYRATIGDQRVLPELFREAGWRTIALGKVHHGQGASDDERSWSEAPWRPERWQRWYASEEARAQQRAAEAGTPEAQRHLVRAVFEDHAEVDEGEFPDALIADEAIQRIVEHAAGGARAGEPLFLAVGFLKPHLPFVSPQKYWDLHQGTNRVLQGSPPLGAPAVALHNSDELRAYLDVPDEGSLSPELASRLVRGYRACASFVDAQVGRIMQALEEREMAEDTLVVLWGDHGWHFNELGMWGKQTNFEQALRVPLVMRGCGVRAGEVDSFVELVDIFPTLASFAGLEAPSGLDGRDLAGALRSGDWRGALTAPRSQYPRGQVMGRTVRDEVCRYTEWERGGEVVATEFYEARVGVNEERNLAGEEPEDAELVRMRALLRDRFAP